MKIVCLSDTHGKHAQLQVPEGDILIHAGDFTKRGLIGEVQQFNDWLTTQPHKHKIVIAGNHDFLFEQNPALAQSLLNEAMYLEDEFVEIEGIKFWGSPITPWFFDWAFNRQRGAEITAHWQKIPKDTDILITHGPPKGILDKTMHGLEVGCQDLLEAVQRICPRYHIFGHIHEAYGIHQIDNTQFINASILDINYKVAHAPVVLEYASA